MWENDRFYHLTDFEVWTDENDVVKIGDIVTLIPNEVCDIVTNDKYREHEVECAICVSPTIDKCLNAIRCRWINAPWKIYIFVLDDCNAVPVPAYYIDDYVLTNEHRIFHPARFKLENIIYNNYSTEGP